MNERRDVPRWSILSVCPEILRKVSKHTLPFIFRYFAIYVMPFMSTFGVRFYGISMDCLFLISLDTFSLH